MFPAPIVMMRAGFLYHGKKSIYGCREKSFNCNTIFVGLGNLYYKTGV